MPERSYLDWNATAPLRAEAKRAVTTALELAGNPSSIHAEGRAARKLVEEARHTIARAVGAADSDVIFTSGATEANAIALQPTFVGSGAVPLQRLIVSAIEHVSVLAGGRFDRSAIEFAPVTADGVVDLDALSAMLDGKPPALVSLMLANNETGVIQPVRAAADLIHAAGGLLHADAVQALGKIPVDLKELGADVASLSAHKLGGPKGVGALVLGRDVQGLAPLIRGGGQERSRRAGTENVPGIAGFGAAVAAAVAGLASETGRLIALRDRLEKGLQEMGAISIFGLHAGRLPNTTLFASPGLRAETAVIAFDLEGIAVSSGSACSSGKVQPSHVLKAMGVPVDLVQGAIRLSTGYLTMDADVNRTLEAWRKLSGVLGKDRRNSA